MRQYEVLAYVPELHNGLDAYVSLGVVSASSQQAAANKALREVADEPLDSEADAILTPDPSIVVLPLSRLVPLEGLRIPQAILDAWADEFPMSAKEAAHAAR